MQGTGGATTIGRRRIGLALVAFLVLASLAGGAAAHRTSDEHGALSFHPGPDEQPQRKLSCGFWVEGHDLTHAEGTLKARHDHGADGEHEHDLTRWEGEPNGSGGWRLAAGPVSVHDTGRFDQVRVFTVWHGERAMHGTEHNALTYEPCPPATDEPPACPADLRAQVHGNGNVGLTWNASEDADTYHVYRTGPNTSLEPLAQTHDTAYVDEDTETDTRYAYQVTAARGTAEAEGCPSVQATAIPFFGEDALAPLAGLGGLAALVVARRS